MTSFASRLVVWQRKHGRHDLPWQGADVYRVWLSEVMLQQTQVGTVIPYFQRFVAAFPNIELLAAATQEHVLSHWSGLGYYARGRNLHRAAQIIVRENQGVFPQQFEQIQKLPGVGRSTAAAICALAYHEGRAILDGNVKRLLSRFCGIEGWPGDNKVQEQLWQLAEKLMPQTDIAIYTQSLMDLGATLCTRSRPKCVLCPVQSDCSALQTDRVTELPAARPRKLLPQKQATFLLIMVGNEILLEKRPDSGIWGGLWCPPQFEDEIGAKDWFEKNALQASESQRLEKFTHTFSHFKLRISPLFIRLQNKPKRVDKYAAEWLEMEAVLSAAIPTPVKKMLGKIYQRQGKTNLRG
mgnify:CR=1 FL=1